MTGKVGMLNINGVDANATILPQSGPITYISV